MASQVRLLSENDWEDHCLVRILLASIQRGRSKFIPRPRIRVRVRSARKEVWKLGVFGLRACTSRNCDPLQAGIMNGRLLRSVYRGIPGRRQDEE